MADGRKTMWSPRLSHDRSWSLDFVCWSTCPCNSEPWYKKSKYPGTTPCCEEARTTTHPDPLKVPAEPRRGIRHVSIETVRWLQNSAFRVTFSYLRLPNWSSRNYGAKTNHPCPNSWPTEYINIRKCLFFILLSFVMFSNATIDHLTT